MKLTMSVQQELEIILDSNLMLVGPDISVPALAERIYDSERTLIEQIQRPWIIARLTWMLYRKTANLPGEGQYTLPSFPVFPTRMTLKDGTRVNFIHGNFSELIEFRDLLRKRRRPRLAVIEKFIPVMAPYAEKRKSITVGEVILLERAKQG